MYKQIIIARKDLNMSPGKLAAQVSHGSMAFLTWLIRNNCIKVCDNRFRVYDDNRNLNGEERVINYRHPDLYKYAHQAAKCGKRLFFAEPIDKSKPSGSLKLCEPKSHYDIRFDIDTQLYEQWINGEFTKCVLQAKNKNQLLKAKTIAEEMGMVEGEQFWLIRDNCYTELEPEEDGRTLTCIGFKPMDAEIIDKIGKKYHLYV